ncbi:MAG TPA: hypothetical protein VFE50_24440 [Cyclobacteriaceae bacterium]|nr:hypothetical protein [Cyclobacteriaceae bacterium]
MGRLILAIITGIIVITILSTGTDLILESTGILPPAAQGLFDTKLLMLATVYRFIYQVIGCYIASMIAKDRAKFAVWFMGIFGAIMWLVGGLANQDLGPIWYSIVGAILSVPSALLGKKIYDRKK